MSTERKPCHYWEDKENVRVEALKYTQRKDFRSKSGSAYNAALKNGWLDEFDWLEKNNDKCRGFWDIYENTKTEALKYTKMSDFVKCSHSAYNASRRNNWIQDFYWLKRDSKHTCGYYTFDICKEISLKCKTRSEFRSLNRRAYAVSMEKGWIDHFTWLTVPKKHPQSYWQNENNCRKEAQKYQMVCDFQDCSPGAYNAALKNGWLKDYVWLQTKQQKIESQYDYEFCYFIAKQYKYKNHFRKADSIAFRVANKNGWIEDYDWFEKSLTREECFNKAKRYEYRIDFKRGDPRAFHRAERKGWIKDYDWFKNGKEREAQQRTIWTKEKCYELALTCRYPTELRKKSETAYHNATVNGWIKDYTWFKSYGEIIHEKGKRWTYEACVEVSKQFTCRSDFKKSYPGAYERSLKMGWINDFVWLKPKNMIEDPIDSVYGYFFSDGVVYIGRTLMRNQKERHREHCSNKRDTVYRYVTENNIDVPKMIIIEDNLTILEGVKREGFWIDYYKNQGAKILNKAPAGSLGSLNSIKWPRFKCFEEASKYTTLHDFAKSSPRAYAKALRKGWITDYFWLKRTRVVSGFWQSYENCYNEAKKYKRLADFCIKSHSAYCSALNHGWIDDYYWFKQSNV